ncbi:MAG: hypothetical protein R3D59_12715 [Paracoccaceae bacterium]
MTNSPDVTLSIADMLQSDLFPLVVTQSVTIGLALLGFWWTLKTDRRKRRDQHVTETLIGAYLAMEDFGARDFSLYNNPSEENERMSRAVERAMAQLQLLGPKDIADEISGFIPTDGQTVSFGGATWEKILKTVRDELRGQLDMEPVDSIPKSLRVYLSERLKHVDR